MAPDGYSRYHYLRHLIQRCYPTPGEGDRQHSTQNSAKKTPLLDVGGNGSWLPKMLAEAGLLYEVSVIDILPVPADTEGISQYVVGSGTAMPFEDNQFPVVVSTDTLEHVPPDEKVAFVTEMIRVSSDLVILSAPFDDAATDQAERSANDFYTDLMGREHRWLAEHFTEEKPSIEATKHEIDRHNLPYLHFSSNPLTLWVQMIELNFFAERFTDALEPVRAINQFYNTHLLEIGDLVNPEQTAIQSGYRHHLVIFTNPDRAVSYETLIETTPQIAVQLQLQAQLGQFWARAGETKQIEAGVNAGLAKKYEALLDEVTKAEKDRLHSITSAYEAITHSKFFTLWQKYTSMKKKFGMHEYDRHG